MSSIDILKAFLSDIQNNSTALKVLGKPANVLNEYQNLLTQLEGNQRVREWGVYRLKDKDYGDFEVVDGEVKWKKRVGVVHSYYREGLVNQPVGIAIHDNKIYVATYTGILYVFDENFSHIGGFAWYGSSPQSNPPRQQYLSGIAVNDDMVVLTMNIPNIVKAFDHDGNLLWQFGDGTVGNPDNTPARANEPMSAAFLPNGNVLIADYRARITGAAGDGVVFEIDGNTGAYVKTHLAYMPDAGHAWNGGVMTPSYVYVGTDPNDGITRVYVSYYASSYIGVFRWDSATDTLEYERVYGKTMGIEVGSLYPRGIDIDYNNRLMYIAMDGPNVIAAIGLDDGDLKGYVGKTMYEDYQDNPNTPVGFWGLRDVKLYNDLLYVADYGNRRISVVPEHLVMGGAVDLEYELMEGSEDGDIAWSSDDSFDIGNKVVRRDVNDVLTHSYSDRILVLRKICS